MTVSAPKRVLLACDRGAGAAQAAESLAFAGLPDDAAVVVLAVAEAVPVPVLPAAHVAQAGPRRHRRARFELDAAQAAAELAAARLRRTRPGWRVASKAVDGDAAEAILGEAAEGFDLVVVGSRASPSAREPSLGSVAHRVVAEAPCSVRVGRVRARAGPLRLLIGYDGSAGADGAVEWVAARPWPAGSSAHLLAVVDPVVGHARHDSGFWTALRDTVAARAGRLRAAGLEARPEVVIGDPRTLLPEFARGWGADTVVVGADGLGGSRLVGGVASAVVAGAPCSVDVVRPLRPAAAPPTIM